MNSVKFNWQKEQNTLLNKYIFKTEGENCTWGRLLCTWHEKGENPQKKRLHHVCFAVDLASLAGDIYIDDSKTTMFFKALGSIILRVIQVSMKTLFHATLPLSLPIILFHTIMKELEHNRETEKKGQLNNIHSVYQISRVCLNNCIDSVADIIRTPVYGLLMTISSLLAVLVAPFAPSKLYDFRKWAGDFEDELVAHDSLGFWKWTPCFHPFSNLNEIYKLKRVKHEDDTDYSECKSQLDINLSNMARKSVLKRRSLENNKIIYNSDNYSDIDPNLLEKLAVPR